MKVFLDSCIVLAEKYHFDTANTQTLLKAAGELHIEIVLPSVVVEEVTYHYEQDLEEKINAYRKAHNDLNTLLSDKIADPTENLDTDILAHQFSRRFKDGLKKGVLPRATFRVADYPSVSHVDAVYHAVRRNKPFADKKDGYRDFLIWRTVMEEATNASPTNPVYFISSNKSDFADDRSVNPETGEIALHGDLKSTMDIRNVPKGSIIYFASLGAFNRDVIYPRLTALDDLAKTVTKGDFPNQKLYDAIPDAISRWLDTKSDRVAVESFSLPDEIIRVDGGYVQGVKDRGQSKVLMLPDGELTILIPVKARVGLFVEAPKDSDFAQNLSDDQIVYERDGSIIGVYRKDLDFLVNALVGDEPSRDIIRVDATLRTISRKRASQQQRR